MTCVIIIRLNSSHLSESLDVTLCILGCKLQGEVVFLMNEFGLNYFVLNVIGLDSVSFIFLLELRDKFQLPAHQKHKASFSLKRAVSFTKGLLTLYQHCCWSFFKFSLLRSVKCLFFRNFYGNNGHSVFFG